MMEEKSQKEVWALPIDKNRTSNDLTVSDNYQMGDLPEKLPDSYLNPDPLEYMMKYVSKRVKHEETLIKLAILIMASTYTPNPLNLALESPQSEGKSYSLVEVSKLFPKNDVWDLGGMTPQVLTRERGYHVDRETGKNIEKELNEIKGEIATLGNSEDAKEQRTLLRAKLSEMMNNAVKIVDMQGKILLFLEAPHHETFARLRPILSRDKYEVEFKFVDRAYKNGPQVTMEARIRGWPVAVYATADNPKGNIWDQIRSRFIVVSPTMNKEKYKAANQYTASKYGSVSNPVELRKEDEELKRCKNYVLILKTELYNKYNQISSEDYYSPENVSFTWNPLAQKLENSFPSTIGQNMRDFKYFMALMDVSCLFSLFNRPYFEVKGYPHWIVTKWDLKNVTEVFDNYHFFIKIGELPIKIFEDIIRSMELKHETVDGEYGFTKKELKKKVGNAGYSSGVRYITDSIISPLEEVGLLTKGKDNKDSRLNVYSPFTENYQKLLDNRFLKIKYDINDFKNDFNEMVKNNQGVNPITMNSKSFSKIDLEVLLDNQFNDHIVFSSEKTSNDEKTSLKHLKKRESNNYPYLNEIEDTTGSIHHQNDLEELSDEDLNGIASNPNDPNASDALNELGLRQIRQKNAKKTIDTTKFTLMEKDILEFLAHGLPSHEISEISRKFVSKYSDYDEKLVKEKIVDFMANGIIPTK